MREALAELLTVAAALDRETQELNGVIDDFEGKLQSAGVGIALWLFDPVIDASAPIRCEDDDGGHAVLTTGWLLGCAQLNGFWRLSAKEVRCEERSNGRDFIDIRGPVPLVQAPRFVRIEAACHLDELAKALTEAAHGYLQQIARAKRLTR